MLGHPFGYNLYQGNLYQYLEAPTDFFQELPIDLEDDFGMSVDQDVPLTPEPYETVHETVHQQTNSIMGRRSHFYFNNGDFAEDFTKKQRHEVHVPASPKEDIPEANMKILRTSKIDEASIAGRLIQHVVNRNYKAMEEILQSGPWANSTSPSGERAYTVACQKNNIEAMLLLLRYGAII